MGRSGEAAALLLLSLGAKVTVLDSAPEEIVGGVRAEQLRGRGVQVIFGAPAETIIDHFDRAIISPGIDPKTPLVTNLADRGVSIIAEIELASENFPVPVVGITGTNGKTTTTELVAAMLLGAGVSTEACGNIGKPYSEVAVEGHVKDLITLEVSSFQLERIDRFRPYISVWLNLTPDHLDRYVDEAEYRTAKLRIFENQRAEDWAIVNFRDELPALAAKRLTFSAYASGADLFLENEVIHYQNEAILDPRSTKLRGDHNTENLMAALGVGIAYGLTAEQMVPALRAYQPQPHRCEVVRELDGVLYVNDSKATNLDALEKALRSERRPVILIAGGKDKGFDFDALTDLVAQRARWVVLIGEMTDRIAASWQERVPCEKAATLADALNIAWSVARPGEAVLFSPGTSSFDMFKSYADRGTQFRALVNALQPSQ